jgi:hypothetical protein
MTVAPQPMQSPFAIARIIADSRASRSTALHHFIESAQKSIGHELKNPGAFF